MTLWERSFNLDHVGWTGMHFALPTGATFSPRDIEVTMNFPEIENRCASSGTFDGWMQEVAGTLAGQKLAQFCIMAMFVPPIMRFSAFLGNPVFEIIGPVGAGKSLLRQLASSVIGRPSTDKGNPYWMNYHFFNFRLAVQIAQHADLSIVLNGMDEYLVGSSKSTCINTVKRLAVYMTDGQVSDRQEQPAGRFVVLSTNHTSVSDLAGSREVAQVTGYALSTIRTSSERAYGAFEKEPKDANWSKYSSDLSTATNRHSGHAMAVFLHALVQAASDDEEKLRRFISKKLELFRKNARVDGMDKAAGRIADSYGLVFAAGELARRYRVLPDAWKCGPAVLACYRNATNRWAPKLPFGERLKRIAQTKGMVHIGRGRPKLTEKVTLSNDAYVSHAKGRKELLIRRSSIENYFPDWRDIEKTDEVRDLIIPESVEEHKWYHRRRLLKDQQIEYFFRFRFPRKVDGAFGGSAGSIMKTSEQETSSEANKGL